MFKVFMKLSFNDRLEVQKNFRIWKASERFAHFGTRSYKIISINGKHIQLEQSSYKSNKFKTACKIALCFTVALPITVAAMIGKAVYRKKYQFEAMPQQNLSQQTAVVDTIGNSRLKTISSQQATLQTWLAQSVDVSFGRLSIGEASMNQVDLDWRQPAILAFGEFDRLDGLPQHEKWRMQRHGFHTNANYLSNYYLRNIVVEGRIYKSVEHYYQAIKFKNHPAIFEQITKAQTADDARRIAQQHQGLANLSNDQEMAMRMKPALWAKFINPNGTPTELGKMLMATGNQPLVEGNDRGNRSDKRWGMKVDFKNMPNAIALEGQNLLGKLLMEIRDILMSQLKS